MPAHTHGAKWPASHSSASSFLFHFAVKQSLRQPAKAGGTVLHGGTVRIGHYGAPSRSDSGQNCMREGWLIKKVKKMNEHSCPSMVENQKVAGRKFQDMGWYPSPFREGGGTLNVTERRNKWSEKTTCFLYSADSHTEFKYLKAQQCLTAGRPAAPAVMSPPCRCSGCM